MRWLSTESQPKPQQFADNVASYSARWSTIGLQHKASSASAQQQYRRMQAFMSSSFVYQGNPTSINQIISAFCQIVHDKLLVISYASTTIADGPCVKCQVSRLKVLFSIMIILHAATAPGSFVPSSCPPRLRVCYQYT